MYFTSPFFDEKYKNLKFLEEAKRYEIVNDIEDEVKECEVKGQFVKTKKKEKSLPVPLQNDYEGQQTTW